MQKYFHFLLAFLVISILIAGESKAENETNDNGTNEDETNDDETNDDETNDDETNDDETNDNETNDDETNGDETKEQSGFCPTEITDENKDAVDDACIVPFDESEHTNSKEEGLLPSLSFFASICAIAIIAFRRR